MPRGRLSCAEHRLVLKRHAPPLFIAYLGCDGNRLLSSRPVCVSHTALFIWVTAFSASYRGICKGQIPDVDRPAGTGWFWLLDWLKTCRETFLPLETVVLSLSASPTYCWHCPFSSPPPPLFPDELYWPRDEYRPRGENLSQNKWSFRFWLFFASIHRLYCV